jgi:hypothetical protein
MVGVYAVLGRVMLMGLIAARDGIEMAHTPAGERASEQSTTFARMSAVVEAFEAAGCDCELVLEAPSDETGKPTKVFKIRLQDK